MQPIGLLEGISTRLYLWCFNNEILIIRVLLSEKTKNSILIAVIMKKIVFVFISLLCLSIIWVCCSDENKEPWGNSEKNQIKLFIPDAEEIVLYSTATGMENYISDCYVVVFNGGVYKNAEKIDVSEIVRNGFATALLPQTSFDLELGDKVYVVCNTGLTALPGGINTENWYC
jgi:hypothetical protein